MLNDPQANYELIHANAKRFPIPVAQSVIDLTMEAEAFGAKIDYTKTGLPTIVEEPVSDRESIEKLKVPEVGDARTHVFLKAAEMAVKNPEGQIVMGNLDSSGVFNEGTPEYVEEMARNLLEKVGSYKNFVLASGCDLSPTTPLENLDAFYKALKEYMKAKNRE
ncbi:MAG: hypothetical protein GX750_01140 [Clostridia bacterium]|nr:hypothetical protein [Clostridia bacterium]